MANPSSITVKTAEDIRDDYLRTIKEGLINLGITNPNVSEGTLDHIRGTALGQFGALLYQNIALKADAQMPDTAQAEDLIRLANIYHLSLRAAGPSSGTIVLDATITTSILIPTGSQLIDDKGLSYNVTVGGSYSDGEEIQITAVDTGAATNLAEGSTLRWVSPPPFVSPTALVGSGGLTGGVDEETYEGLRTRILEKIRNPPGGGNWSQLNQAAEDSTVAVQKSFAYPACEGRGTVHVAVVTSPTDSDKTRDVNSVILSTKIIPAVQAVVPEYFELVVTTVQNQNVDVAINISIPSATTASPPGPGGGWLSGTPWPTYSALGYSNVTSVSSSTVFTVRCDSDPTIGVTQICWLNPNNWTLYRGTVTSFTGTFPSVTVTVDTPFTGIAVGSFVFPDAELMQEYVNTLLEAFANLGPGQKTSQTGLLPRAYRRPLTTEAWPSDLNDQVLRRLTDNNDTILSASYSYRNTTTPTLPSSISDGPYILVPRNLAFYPSF
jgi:uncharacterized phage protein gp47/JayE